MKREKRQPKPGFCLVSAVVWALMAVVWGREAMVWQNAFRLGLVEASGVWLRSRCAWPPRGVSAGSEAGDSAGRIPAPPGLRRKKTENLNKRRNIQWLTRRA